MDIQSPSTRTHDLGLAVALVSCGFELRATNRDINGRFYFVFEDTDELGHGIDAYWDNVLDVKARTLVENMKVFKGRIYSEQ